MFSVKTLDKTQIQSFVDSYNDRKITLADAARGLGCSVPTAGRLLKANGAQMRAKGRPKGSKTINRNPRIVVTPGAPESLGSEATRVAFIEEQAQTEAVAENPLRATEDFVSFQQRVMAGNV